jgi:hypothetical protein
MGLASFRDRVSLKHKHTFIGNKNHGTSADNMSLKVSIACELPYSDATGDQEMSAVRIVVEGGQCRSQQPYMGFDVDSEALILVISGNMYQGRAPKLPLENPGCRRGRIESTLRSAQMN